MGPFLKKMETRRLRDTDMKKLVRILRGVQQDASESKEARYRWHTKEHIHVLPRHLRASQFTLHATNLCSMHKGLDAHLMNEIWSWLQHEFEGAVGQFLYPIIMSGRLSATEELTIRQLEPVSRVWRRDWNLQDSAPAGHEPIQRGSQWAYQQDQCPACILGRIGSDGGVLFALFAGMVGRFNTRSLANAEALGSSDAWEKTKSKRLRFAKYWLRATRDGDAAVVVAGALGMKMRRLRREWQEEQHRVQCEQQISPARPSLNGSNGTTIFERGSVDSKIGPAPRPAEIDQYSPASSSGFGIPASSIYSIRAEPSQPMRTISVRTPSSDSIYSIHIAREDSIELLMPAPLRPNRPNPPPVHQATQPPSHNIPSQALVGNLAKCAKPQESQYAALVSTLTDSNHRTHSVISPLPQFNHQASSSCRARPYSIASAHTIFSYDGSAPSHPRQRRQLTDPFDSPIYATLVGGNVDVYGASALPKPKCGSMYGAFGDGRWDAGQFEGVDEELGEEEPEDDGDGDGDEVEVEDGLDRAVRLLRPKVSRGDTGHTAWEDLY